MKKGVIAGIIMLSLTMSVMTGCSAAAGAGGQASGNKYVLEARTYPMRTELDRNGVKEREITLYFVNGGDIPYVALTESLILTTVFRKTCPSTCLSLPARSHAAIWCLRSSRGPTMSRCLEGPAEAAPAR